MKRSRFWTRAPLIFRCISDTAAMGGRPSIYTGRLIGSASAYLYCKLTHCPLTLYLLAESLFVQRKLQLDELLIVALRSHSFCNGQFVGPQNAPYICNREGDYKRMDLALSSLQLCRQRG